MTNGAGGTDDSGTTERVPLSPSERAKLRKRAWLVVAYTVSGAGIIAIVPAYAMVRDGDKYRGKGHVSDTAFILLGSGVAVMIGLFFLVRILLDLRDGTVNRYTGTWKEKLFKARAGSYTRLKLAGHRRGYRMNIAAELRQAVHEGIDRHWQLRRGHVDIARRSRIVLEARRDRSVGWPDPPAWLRERPSEYPSERRW